MSGVTLGAALRRGRTDQVPELARSPSGSDQIFEQLGHSLGLQRLHQQYRQVAKHITVMWATCGHLLMAPRQAARRQHDTAVRDATVPR